MSICMLPVIIDIERTSLAASFQNRRLFTRNNRTFGRWGGYFFWVIASKYPVATTSNTIASNSVILTHPLSGGKKPPQVRGRSAFIIWYIPAKSQTYYRKSCSEHTLQTGLSFYPCCHSFPLVKLYVTCYNGHRKNVLNGIFP